MGATKNVQGAAALKVGIAIVCWNNESILSQCLESIQSKTYKNIETIVLDNNSSDGSVKLVEQNYPWVTLIKSSTNTGFARGNNIVIEEHMKDKEVAYMVLLNSDANLEPHWVETLVTFAMTKQNIAFMQGLTLDYYDHNVVDSTHIFINRKGQAIQSNHRQQAKDIAVSEPKRVFGVNAAACMISREYLETQPFDHLFDEDFFMYLEDVDIVARSIILGWENYFVPDAIAYHMGSASSGKNPGFSVYMVNRNRWPLLLKNLPLAILIKIIPGMMAGDAQELYRIARGKNYMIIRKFISGRTVGFLTVFKYMRKRRLILRSRKISSKVLWSIMLDGTLKNN